MRTLITIRWRSAEARIREFLITLIIEALSAHWGWHPEDGGKAIFAILAKETGA
jgi:hypothetical protein